MGSKQTTAFVSFSACLALAVTATVAVSTPAVAYGDVEAAVFFGIAALVAHSLAYRLRGGGFGNIAFIPLLSGVAVAPSLPSVIATGTALLVGEYFRRREPIHVVFNASQLTIAVGLAVIVYTSAGGERLTEAGLSNLVPFVAAFGAFFVTNAVLFAGVVSASSRERFASVLLRAAGGASLVYDLVGIPIVFGFAYAYVRIGWAWSGALLLPLFGIRQMYKVNRELQTVNEELLQLMVAAIEARDPYTSGHSQRVAAYSRVVSRAAGLGPRATERVFTAALLHDVGKIHEEFAPILRKPGRLTDDEFAVMKSHSAKGAALVSKVSQFEDLIPAVRGHHEAWNGTGYPDGLRGDSIPLWARVIAFADTIDAMTTNRPYREALTAATVREEVVRQAGRQFDPSIAAALTADGLWKDLVAAVRARSLEQTAIPSDDAVPERHSAAYQTAAG